MYNKGKKAKSPLRPYKADINHLYESESSLAVPADAAEIIGTFYRALLVRSDEETSPDSVLRFTRIKQRSFTIALITQI